MTVSLSYRGEWAEVYKTPLAAPVATNRTPPRKTRREDRGFGYYHEEEKPVTPKEVLSKWSEFGTRLANLREKHGSDFADFAAGQLAVVEAVIGDLAVSLGKEQGRIVVSFRRRSRLEIEGQLKLTFDEEQAA